MLHSRIYTANMEAFDGGARLIANKGGTRSTKTYSILQFLFLLAVYGRPNRSIDVVSESLPHLKRGAIKDWNEILDAGIRHDDGRNVGYEVNMSDMRYTFPSGTTVSFFSADNWGKVKGSRRDILFINEANRIDWETYRQLAVRTTEAIFIDWNPDSEYWYEENKLNLDPSTIEIKSTYKDNDFLTAAQIAEIERNRERDPQWWRVYGEGEVGIPTGLIYTDHHLVDSLPDTSKMQHVRGLDFGYSCFSGDTLITTSRGEVPIKDVVAGDYVLTRKGYRKVKKNIYNGRKKVIEKKLVTDLHSSVIFATFEHNFNANGKWKKYGELMKGDKLFVMSPLTELSSSDTQMENTRTTTTTNGKRTGNTNQSCCTMQCTNTITGQYQRAKSFITRTLIRLTTTLKTLSQSLGLNIAKFINHLKSTQPQNTQERCAIQKTTGTRGEKKSLLVLLRKFAPARLAKKNLLQPTRTKDFAQKSVTINGNTPPPNSTLSLPANGVGESLWATNTSNPRPAEASAHIKCLELLDVVTGETKICEVYDLEIEEVHEYFANGFLVHNCDPTALVDVYIDTATRTIWCDELLYRTGMTNHDIANAMKAQGINPNIEIFCDAAEPKSIAELHRYGFNVKPAYKKDLNSQIQWLKGYTINITKSSLNGIKELRNYKWKTDKDGKSVNEPVDLWNHCFVGNTPILTDKGYKAIKDIEIGDVVLNSHGFCRVKNKFNNGEKNVVNFLLYLQGNQIVSLTCTPNHKIKTTSGWKEISRLKSGDCLYLAKSLTENDFTSIMESVIFQRGGDACTALYGSISTEQFPKDTTYTTKTEIRKTTASKILSLSNALSIFHSTKKASQWRRKSQQLIMRGFMPANGIGVQRAGRGTQSMAWRLQNTSSLKTSPVLCAEKSLRVKKQAQNSAAIPANQNTGGCKDLTTSQNNVPIAAKSSCQTNTARRSAVQTVVLQNIDGSDAGKAVVYDLEIENYHEYIANGIVVHNCLDALRYAAYTSTMVRPVYSGGKAKLNKLADTMT